MGGFFMKRMIPWMLLTLIGFAFSFFCFANAVLNPGVYNSTGGMLGAFLCAETLVPFILSTAAMCAGVALCAWEAYRGK